MLFTDLSKLWLIRYQMCARNKAEEHYIFGETLFGLSLL